MPLWLTCLFLCIFFFQFLFIAREISPSFSPILLSPLPNLINPSPLAFAAAKEKKRPSNSFKAIQLIA